jgi:hypothetical protein
MKTKINEINVEIKDREFKSYTKRTYTAKLKVGKKSYPIKQYDYFYNRDDLEADIQSRSHWADTWYITTAQMKSIINNNEIETKQTAVFDGMQDMQVNIRDNEFSVPSDSWKKVILEDLSRKGLMRCHYNAAEDIFELWSCCSDYKIWVKGLVEFQ